MATFKHYITVDLTERPPVYYIGPVLYEGEALADTLIVTVLDNGEAASLSGTVSGKIVRPDGETTGTSGLISDNVITFTLPAAAYAITGPIRITVTLTEGSEITTIVGAVAVVQDSTTSTTVDPGTIISSIDTLIAEIESAVALIPADYTALVEAVESINGAEKIDFTSGGYITTSGTTVDMNTVNPNANMSYAIVSCSEGDIFTISGTGAANGRLWAFADLESNILSKSGSTVTADNLQLTAPENAAYLILNSSTADICFKGELLSVRVQAIEDEGVTGNIEYIQTVAGKKVAAGSGAITTNAAFDYVEFTVLPGDTLTYLTTNDESEAGLAFYDTDGTYISGVLGSTTAQSVTVPDGATTCKACYRTGRLDDCRIEYSKTLTPVITAIQEEKAAREDQCASILNCIGLDGTIEFTSGAIYNYTSNIQDAIESPHASASWYYAVLSCAEGDKFTVNADSSTSGYVFAYTFADSNYDVILANSANSVRDTVIEAPADAAYLVINRKTTTTYQSYAGASAIVTLQKAVSNFAQDRLSCGMGNMAWTWWTYPQVVHFNRVRNKVYWGYTNADGYIGVAEYDVATGNVLKNSFARADTADDHDAAAVYVYDDGTILCAHATGHNQDNNIHIHVSSSPESVEAFNDEVVISSKNPTTYSQLIFYDDKLYLFYRSGPYSWAYRYTADQGATWTDEVILITSEVQYYCKFVPTTTSGVIRIVMYSNPSSGDTDIRQAFLHLDDGIVYNSDNSTALGTSEISKDNVTVLIAKSSGHWSQRLLDVAVTAIASPRILYAVFPSSATEGVYYLYDTGTIINVGSTGTTILSYTPLGASWIGTNKIAIGICDGTNDIIKVMSYANGVVTVDETVATEAMGSIPIRQIHPIVDINGYCFIWERGYYGSTYTDFNTDVKIHFIS